jgi:hypothetical protein
MWQTVGSARSLCLDLGSVNKLHHTLCPLQEAGRKMLKTSIMYGGSAC